MPITPGVLVQEAVAQLLGIVVTTCTDFGGYGAMRVARFQELLKFINLNGFEHHAALNPSQTAGVLEEAFTRYLGWETYRHA